MIPVHTARLSWRPSFPGPRWLIVGALVMVLVVGAWLLWRHARTPLELWPDIVCQAYLGWRVATGESLYVDLWDSHPPLAVFYAAIFHLAAPPAMATAHAMVLGTAILYGSALALLTYAGGVRNYLIIIGLSSLGAGVFSSLFANARSEDLVIILGTTGIACALRFSSGGRLRWSLASGVAVALALLAKPAAVAAGIIAFALHLLDPRWKHGVAAFLAGGIAVGTLALLYFLEDHRYLFFLNQAVDYGSIYFRPLSPPVLAEGLQNAIAFPTKWGLLLLSLVLGLGLPWFLHGGIRLALLMAWPTLELGMSLLQTTYFPYVFFPFQASLLTLTIVFAAIPISSRPLNAAETTYAIRLHCALAVAVVLTIGSGIYVLGDRAATARALAFASRNDPLEAFAGTLASHRASFNGEMLWLDAGPGIGYLAGAHQAIPEYVAPPLFNTAYADEQRWVRARQALSQVKLLTAWKEWYDPVEPASDIWTFPSYRAFRSELLHQFDKVGEFEVYAGRGPVVVYIRKGELVALRNELANLKTRLD